LWDGADLDWYDYGFRNYDPQVGRFPQLDPLTDDYPELTPYQYASNDPISNIDIDGLEGGSALEALSAIPTGAMATEKSLAPVVLMGLSQAAKSSGSFFSAVGNFLSKAGSSLVNGAKGFINEMNRRAKVNINKDISWVKGTVNQLGANAKANWASGNTLIQQLPQDFMENPLEFLEGGAELDMLKGVGMEAESFSKYEIRKGANEILPSLDATGKVHGVLPKIKDLDKYSKDELQSLLKELKQSVQRRIEVTSKLGRDRAHGQRQGAEQDLIKAIEKHLQNR
jgi:RHS repeat-associated protein